MLDCITGTWKISESCYWIWHEFDVMVMTYSKPKKAAIFKIMKKFQIETLYEILHRCKRYVWVYPSKSILYVHNKIVFIQNKSNSVNYEKLVNKATTKTTPHL